ncbi:MAG TPA: hypothetical protein VH351_22150 [Bryobacteraceae bacterium]|jgi:hypothetical protein|nr:hypothetical protein [Bryobacteraceae bacterium]
MPCLLAILAVAFPRVAIILLWLFTNFFTGVYHGIIVPVLGFIFLPLTLIVYTYIQNRHMPLGATQLIFLFLAVVIDLGLMGGGGRYGRRRA